MILINFNYFLNFLWFSVTVVCSKLLDRMYALMRDLYDKLMLTDHENRRFDGLVKRDAFRKRDRSQQRAEWVAAFAARFYGPCQERWELRSHAIETIWNR